MATLPPSRLPGPQCVCTKVVWARVSHAEPHPLGWHVVTIQQVCCAISLILSVVAVLAFLLLILSYGPMFKDIRDSPW